MAIHIPEPTRVPIDDVTVDGQNPNIMSQRQHDSLANSITRFGFIVPIITNKDLLIADGEQRWRVAKSLGMTHVPVIRLDVKDVDRRLLRQVLNKLKGEHREDLDAQEFLKIVEAGERESLQRLIDLKDAELQRHLDLLLEPKPEDYPLPEIDKIETPIQRGDIYQLGSHRLMCGDATSKNDVEALMNGEHADMVFTDPPYGINVVSRATIGGSKPATFGKIGDANLTAATVYPKIIGDDEPFDPQHLLGLAPKLAIFGGNYFAHKLPPSAGWLVWDKEGGQEWRDTFADCELIWTNRTKHAQIYRCTWKGMVKEGESGKRLHPTQKPIKLLSEIIQDFTTNPNIILDPYGGSGSTLIACEATGRRCHMMEIDPRYCQVIINRWEAYAGKEAQKVAP
jgi:site-specific DNA-methyltransferase (adenine-specific)